MIRQTIEEIEARIRNSRSISEEGRGDLLKLMVELKAEVTRLSESDAEQAQSIARFTDVSAHEATRESRNPALLHHSVEGLRASVSGFESSHPRLVDVVNSICTTLSNLGI